MERLNTFEDLAEAARQETIDAFDVSGRVIKCLRTFSPTDTYDLFFLFGVISAVAAVILFWLGTTAWDTLTSPLTIILSPIQSVLW